MTTTIWAVFENGSLRPMQPLPLTEGETVQLTVTQAPNTGAARMREAKSLDELFAAFPTVPQSADGYDLLRALDENRKGERVLFPPEAKGVTW